MDELKDFFNEERKRVFTPGPYFTQRVMARVNEQQKRYEYGIWDAVPRTTRPVFAAALILVLGFLGIQMFVPQTPQRGMIEAFLEPDQNPGESLLFSETEPPQGFLEHLVVLEDQQ